MRIGTKAFLKVGSAFLLMHLMSFISFSQDVPKDPVLLEAEDFHIKSKAFKEEIFLHASGGNFIARNNTEELPGDVEIFKAEFPKDSKEYTVWAYSKNLDMGIWGPLTEIKKLSTSSDSWEWHNLGRFNKEKIGETFSIFAVAGKGGSVECGLDCVLLSADPDFKPQGVYSGYSPEPDAVKGVAEKASSSPDEVDVKVFPDKKQYQISKYIASANAHIGKRHILDIPEWNTTMKEFFSGNILCLAENAYKKKPDENGIWWDFKSIDEFIRRAKNEWKVDEVLLLPAWWPENHKFTDDDLETGKKVLMQLVERYGKPGPLYVKYWVLFDEWPGVTYWKENYKKFAEYHASLFREMKKVNPDLKIGGPVDCWPDDKIIAEVLRQCPDLDFIAWNMYITGRADTPLPKLFNGIKNYKLSINSSRQLGKKILNRDIPVMVTGFGPNYHAWAPPDYKLAQPIIGVWNALALSYMAESRCSGAFAYTTIAVDCGLFGPKDPFAIRSGMIPADIDKNLINIRPNARMIHFFKKNVAGRDYDEVAVSGKSDKFNAVAASGNNEVSIVMVNFSENVKSVNLSISPYERTAYSGFDLPDEYFYCDETKELSGKGLFFSADGKANLLMPPYSTWCINIKYRKPQVKNAQ